jgi:hypothetical protein
MIFRQKVNRYGGAEPYGSSGTRYFYFNYSDRWLLEIIELINDSWSHLKPLPAGKSRLMSWRGKAGKE